MNGGPWRRALRVTVVVALGAISTMVVAEGALRIGRKLREPAPQKTTVPTAGESARIVKIVALGESTTAPAWFHGREVSWPTQLEAMLNRALEKKNSELRVQVENFGKPSVSSYFLVEALRERLKKGSVDIVVSMMGINDGPALQRIERNWLYEHSVLFRFIYWARFAWECPACFTEDRGADEWTLRKIWSPREIEAHDKAYKLLEDVGVASPDRLREFKKQIEALQKDYGDSQHLMNLSVAMWLQRESISPRVKDQKGLDKEIYAEIKILNQISRATLLQHDRFVSTYCFIELYENRDCLETIKEAWKKGLSPTLKTMTLVSYGPSAEDPFIRRVFESRGFKVNREFRSLETVRDSYRQLARLVEEGPIRRWYAMQYPTGTTQAIRWIFSSEVLPTMATFADTFSATSEPTAHGFALPEWESRVVYVSNENFKTIATGDKKDLYFYDLFGRSVGLEFGHTTELGHKLIAENLYREIAKDEIFESALRDSLPSETQPQSR